MRGETEFMDFDYSEDREYFRKLLCASGEKITRYSSLFNFDSLEKKRRAFNNISKEHLEEIKGSHRSKCLLRLSEACSGRAEVIDHLIPLATNKLNKLRGLKPRSGKKVSSQSFGSNHDANLISACKKCNSHKKHILLDREQIQRILKESGFFRK
jgi:hypothetical protein